MTTVAIIQSGYIPWKGYFDIIHDVDLFIFYDDVQFTKHDWRNRNKIKTDKGAEWLTVPVATERSRLICDVTIAQTHWQARHWKAITQHYGKCRFFADFRDALQDIYLGRQWASLSQLNQSVTRRIATEFLGITTRFADSRAYSATGHKLDRLLDILRKAGATRYVSGPAARAYIDPARFVQDGIELAWKDYAGYPEYPQRYAPFEHGVTVLDLLFNTGPNAAWHIWGWRSPSPP